MRKQGCEVGGRSQRLAGCLRLQRVACRHVLENCLAQDITVKLSGWGLSG